MNKGPYVSVPLPALKSLIGAADGWRFQADQEFVCGREEQDASNREMEDLIAALELPEWMLQ